MSVEVYLEIGAKRVFACAVDWPGWARSDKDEEAALDALAAYADRYRPVAERAGVKGPPKRLDLQVVERVKGGSTTDFGAPGSVADLDRRPTTAAQARRLRALVEASWATLADVAADAPATLAKGPRGGGRDRDDIVRHVSDAEHGYASKLGVKGEDLRAAILEHLGTPSDGSAPTGPRGGQGWPVRYAARRIAWHALDHAWEIEDKSG